MKDFQSVKQREGAWNIRVHFRPHNGVYLSFVGNSVAFDNARGGAIPLCSSGAGIDSMPPFIRWENVCCNVIYLPRTDLSQPAPQPTLRTS
jgi:hypothetical protein